MGEDRQTLVGHKKTGAWAPVFWCSVGALLVEEGAQVFAAGRVAQLAQGLGFDLADTLAGDVELLAHFLEGVVGVHVDAEAHAQDLGGRSGSAC